MVCHDGSFGSVCDNGWDSNDAKVVCRMLGYPADSKAVLHVSLATYSLSLPVPPSLDAEAYAGGAQYYGAYGDIILENLECTGDENHVYDCNGNKFGDNTCTHDQDAGIICPGK